MFCTHSVKLHLASEKQLFYIYKKKKKKKKKKNDRNLGHYVDLDNIVCGSPRFLLFAKAKK